jgi:hypothetical protein
VNKSRHAWEIKNAVGKPGRRWKGNTEMDLKALGWEKVNRI